MRISIEKKAFDVTLENIAADKSISHRAALFSLLSDGECIAHNYLMAQDCLHTLELIKALGAQVRCEKNSVFIKAPEKILSPSEVLDCGNSGTLMRLAIGLLACLDGFFVLSGDKYLNARPMRRVSEILNDLGAKISGRDNANLAPLCICGSKIPYFDATNHLKSAQVKSALILAGLLSNGCKIQEDEITRDHSENLLKLMGANIQIARPFINVLPMQNKLKNFEITVPNDPSSAFFFAVLAAISPNSKITLKNILLNDTRIEAYKVLVKMGAQIEFIEEKNDYEKIGSIVVKGAKLRAIEISNNISWLIDEIPALSVAFAYADGNSIVKNAKELRVKECDRIKACVYNLRQLGLDVEEFEDGFSVKGQSFAYKKADFKSFADHRIAMSFSLFARDFDINIDDCSCVNISFTNFYDLLKEFGAKYEY